MGEAMVWFVKLAEAAAMAAGADMFVVAIVLRGKGLVRLECCACGDATTAEETGN